MQKLDAPALAASLNALAETFDRKALTPKAIEVWFDTLREFPTELVLGLLGSWPKLHGKMPVPAEVWKVLNERSIDAREQRAKAEKAQRDYEYKHMDATPESARCLSIIYEMLTRPRKTPIEHWESVLATEGLPAISYEYARIGLARIKHRNAA